MLTKMPKVGDVLIAKDCPQIHAMGDMTPGKEYEVLEIDYRGEAVIEDDDGDDRAIDTHRFARFNLKKVMPKKVGFIEFEDESHHGDGTSTVTLYVDSDGFQSLCALRDSSVNERQKSQIVGKIAQCQAEMERLNALLAEVE